MAGTKWTDAEDAILREHCRTHSAQQIADMLPGRTKRSIYHRAYGFGLVVHELCYQDRRNRYDHVLSERLSEPLSAYLHRRYVDEQATYRELCAELGINTRTLMRRMTACGIQPISDTEAGKRNYSKHKAIYDQSFSIKNADWVREKGARTRQANWQDFASPQARAIIEAVIAAGFHPIPEFAVHKFNIDFAFPDVRLAVEVDGGNWHQSVRHLMLQAQKEAWLASAGWTVLRLKTGDSIDFNVTKVSDTLKSLAITQPR